MTAAERRVGPPCDPGDLHGSNYKSTIVHPAYEGIDRSSDQIRTSDTASSTSGDSDEATGSNCNFTSTLL